MQMKIIVFNGRWTHLLAERSRQKQALMKWAPGWVRGLLIHFLPQPESQLALPTSLHPSGRWQSQSLCQLEGTPCWAYSSTWQVWTLGPGGGRDLLKVIGWVTPLGGNQSGSLQQPRFGEVRTLEIWWFSKKADWNGEAALESSTIFREYIVNG